MPSSAGAYQAFITHANGGGAGVGSVSSISTETNTLVRPTFVLGQSLRGIDISPEGDRAYVVDSFGGKISVVATASNTRAAPDIGVGGRPSRVAITPDGTKAYVTNRQDGNVSVIDTATNLLAGPDIPVGGGPVGIAIAPDGTRAYVTKAGGNSAVVLDMVTNAPLGPDIPLGDEPFEIAITPDGMRAYAVNLSSNDVSVIDTVTNTAVLPNIAVGNGPDAIAITPDGERAYVANFYDNDVSVIDTLTNTLAGPDIPVGSLPSGLAVTPDGARVYVTNQADGDVSVIDTATNVVVASNISTKGDGPYGIAIASVPPPPSPILAKKVNVEPVKGKVTTRCRGEKKFTRLSEAEQIPVGCLVDTRKGTVELTSARDAAGGVQSAEFRAGLFRVTQKKANTELKLAGSTGCPKPKKKRSASALLSSSLFANTSRKKGKKGKKGGRRLWGKGKGRFTTKGKYGSASVRGTTWLVQDRCDRSTLFRVSEGKVKVRDFVKKKNVTLKKGGRYVARAGRG